MGTRHTWEGVTEGPKGFPPLLTNTTLLQDMEELWERSWLFLIFLVKLSSALGSFMKYSSATNILDPRKSAFSMPCLIVLGLVLKYFCHYEGVHGISYSKKFD